MRRLVMGHVSLELLYTDARPASQTRQLVLVVASQASVFSQSRAVLSAGTQRNVRGFYIRHAAPSARL